jgi:hypothetical protein
VKIGDTFIWSPDGRKERLYIAVTDPNKNGGRFVAFNLTKSQRGPNALTLKVGDHPFITKYDSDVNFGDGLIVNIANLQGAFDCRQAFPHAPMRIQLVERIARHAKGNPAVSGAIEKLIVAEWKL